MSATEELVMEVMCCNVEYVSDLNGSLMQITITAQCRDEGTVVSKDRDQRSVGATEVQSILGGKRLIDLRREE